MRFSSTGARGSSVGDRRTQQGFSMTDVMVATAIFIFVIGGVLTAHYFGISMYQFMREKLGAGDATRKAFNRLNSEIRTAVSFKLGTGTASTFTELGINTAQQANAIQLYPTSSSNTFIRYYRDSTDKSLKRVTESGLTPAIIAEAVNNTLVFTCENFAGTILTNRTAACLVGINIQYYELPDSHIPIGTGKYYKTYQLQSKVKVRTEQ